MRVNQTPLSASRLATRKALRTVLVVSLALLMSVVGLTMSVAALPVGDVARSNAYAILGIAGDALVLVFIFALVGLLVLAAAWKGIPKMAHKLAAVAVVGFLWAVVLMSAFSMPIGPAGQPPGNGGGLTPVFEVLVPSTVQGTPRDTQAELFDTQGGTGGGGESPTATLCAFGTNAQVDRSGRSVRWDITVDDDVSTGTATFSAPDSCAHDLAVRLTNPRDVNGDGVQDSVSFFGRLRSISATTAQDGNQTTPRNIFMFDTVFGWYVGFSRRVDTQTTDGTWLSVAPPGVSDAQLKTSFDWQNLGSTTGADEDYIGLAAISRNYGFYGYTLPPAGAQYTFVWDIGTPESYVTYTWTVQLAARA